MYTKIQQHIQSLIPQFDSISSERKAILAGLAAYIQKQKNAQLPILLNYICTHNSRRSHLGQIWSAVAAHYYSIPNVQTFSGGTEATALNSNIIEALKTTGFSFNVLDNKANPIVQIHYSDEHFVTCFSKVFDHEINPTAGFAAIMTCSNAEENCPFIPGVDLRISTTYDDPKAFDGTSQESEKYLERSNQIALEIVYVFSLVN